MITLLKTKGYKLTRNDTLNNREFRELDKSVEINEDLSMFGRAVYNTNEIFELFLSDKTFTDKKIHSILDDGRTTGFRDFYIETGYVDPDYTIDLRGYDELTANVERQERGFLITFTTIKQGV
jgi:spore germination protein YaaH